MAATDIATLGNLVLQFASAIQNTGNNWYRASADWTDFPQKVENLRRKHCYWVARLTEYGMLSDTSLMETLRAAEVSLREEQAKLSKRQSKSRTKLLSKVSLTMFPARIGIKLQCVIDRFDAIPDRLEFEQKTKVALDWRMMAKARSLALWSDKCYVPLKVSESRIHSALEDANGTPIVLLYGLCGKGKSALARHTALHYHNTAKSNVFERVVLLDCGREADPSTKQLDLLEQLGPSIAVAPQAHETGESSSAATIRRRLSSFLRHQKLLLILDDVWEKEFLRQMIDLCGVGVRCLVTSRRGDLCQGLRFSVTRIQIEDAQLREAGMEILAGHVGFKDKMIPPHLQEVAKKIVDETQGHPLALASIATAIDEDRSDDLEEWDIVYHTLLHVLRSTEDTTSVLGDKYSKCFWSTMRLSIQSLEPNVLKLLILVSMCTGPSVPEEILQVLYIRPVFQAGFETFRKARKELEIQELITITALDNERSWSVHSLLKLFMEEEMSDQKESIFPLLAPVPTNTGSTVKPKVIGEVFGDEDAVIQTAICALYFDNFFSDRAASSLDIPLNRLNNLRRDAIKPITRLLGRPVNERWTAPSQASAKQVFWTYISNCTLDNDGILHLSTMPISILPVLDVLHGIATIEDHPALAASAAEETKRLILQFPGALPQLITFLSEDGSHELQQRAARALASLAASEVEEMKSTIIQFPGALEQLTRLLRMDTVPESQKCAAMGLANLASSDHEEIKRTIIQYEGAVYQLIRLLSKEAVPESQRLAAKALANLADSKLEEIRRTIIQFPGAVEKLIRVMFKDVVPQTQKFALIALANLERSTLKEIRHTIIQFPGALEQLITLLSKDAVPEVQEQATRALANLAGRGAFEDIRHTIIQFPGALEQLITLLSKDAVPKLQVYAAKALANLARSTSEDIERTIIQFPGALEQVITLLSKDAVPKLQGYAAKALANLARSTSEDIERTIIQFPGALQQLIKLLSKDAVPEVQEQAIKALADLAGSTREDIKHTIIQFPGALEQLIQLLSKDAVPKLQEYAAKALANLACSASEDNKCTIVQFPGALEQLITLLSKDAGPELQRQATRALANLAWSAPQEMKCTIIQFPGAVEQLTRLVLKDAVPELQKQATRALANLRS